MMGEMIDETAFRGYNEMVRYETYMDELRALSSWMVTNTPDQRPGEIEGRNWGGLIFELIKGNTSRFAVDIAEQGHVRDATLDQFKTEIEAVMKALKITSGEVSTAHKGQIHIRSGFWEMRRFFGQFPEIIGQMERDGIADQMVCAGISGCVVGEYLGLMLQRDGIERRVDHMIFEREGKIPVRGRIPWNFELMGKRILLVEDAVTEIDTLGVMRERLREIDPDLTFSLFTMEIDEYDPDVTAMREEFENVYYFSE